MLGLDMYPLKNSFSSVNIAEKIKESNTHYGSVKSVKRLHLNENQRVKISRVTKDYESDLTEDEKEDISTAVKKIGGSKSMHQINHKLIHDQQFFRKKLA